MRSINKQLASCFAGDNFFFHDIVVSIYYDIWFRMFIAYVYRPGVIIGDEVISKDMKIASFHFDNVDDAIEIGEHVLAKIAISNALFGWI